MCCVRSEELSIDPQEQTAGVLQRRNPSSRPLTLVDTHKCTHTDTRTLLDTRTHTHTQRHAETLARPRALVDTNPHRDRKHTHTSTYTQKHRLVDLMAMML